ncbi:MULTISPECIES: hypothetical protein [Bradyrhizobium]|uniref:hypothetical protein n=1 Tax=Bradyrhizobium TaxID=374 RepID=UPI00042941FC|nr:MULTISPECIES: hypothetical protein [Bradyrhizobium]UFW48189.1 transposase family protein [Bradyrhizobium arachidis]
MSQHLSRPQSTVAIDAETRMILGHHIDFEPPGIRTALLAMQQAIQNADPWYGWGRPAEILIDRSGELQSASLRQALSRLENDTTPKTDPQS